MKNRFVLKAIERRGEIRYMGYDFINKGYIAGSMSDEQDYTIEEIEYWEESRSDPDRDDEDEISLYKFIGDNFNNEVQFYAPVKDDQ